MEVQTRVKNTSNGKSGVVVNDPFGCCADWETSVVYDGETASLGTDTTQLEILGAEGATPDMPKCGAGKGTDCCIFLTVSPDGPCCERFSSMRWQLIFKKDMSAQRHPPEPWPDCMNQQHTTEPTQP